MNTLIKQNVDHWLNGGYDAATKAEIERLMEENPQEIVDAFYTNLSFGTAGMRGIIGVGTNRMNPYTVRAATQALANYINKQPKQAQTEGVFIGYDSRQYSQIFAEESAKVLAANGIKAYLCSALRPTPFVSFGCRYKHCLSAIMITASHNPPQYNGYKVYWSDGGQVLPPHDKGIIAEFNAITDISQVKKVKSLSHPLIEIVGKDVDEAYLQAISKQQNYPKENAVHGKELKVVYSSLHGTGITLMPQALKLWGFNNVSLVEKQCIPDPHFSTAPFPNPEEHEAMKMGMDQLKRIQGDIFIATDPDADRLGVAVRVKDCVELLNGNQIACLCLYHICEALSLQKRWPQNAAFIKSIVTTELFQAIVDGNQGECFNVLPGFKYIAEKIRNWEQEKEGKKFIFAAEESYGYLLGTQTRDKDAILAGSLICEVALHAKLKGKTLLDMLEELYRKYGVFVEEVTSLNFPETKEGKEHMASGMAQLRQQPLKNLAGFEVKSVEDCEKGNKVDLISGKTEKIALPKSNVLIYWLKDGSKVVVRPSGTEPKIKLYCGIKKQGPISEALKQGKEQSNKILNFLKNLLHT